MGGLASKVAVSQGRSFGDWLFTSPINRSIKSHFHSDTKHLILICFFFHRLIILFTILNFSLSIMPLPPVYWSIHHRQSVTDRYRATDTSVKHTFTRRALNLNWTTGTLNTDWALQHHLSTRLESMWRTTDERKSPGPEGTWVEAASVPSSRARESLRQPSPAWSRVAWCTPRFRIRDSFNCTADGAQ